jgi:tRNA-dihydrouridine synthase B
VAEYDTIRAIKAAVSIPVIANGDIISSHKAKQVLDYTGADAVMIGRAARGRPWIFKEIAYFLTTGQRLPEPSPKRIQALLMRHLDDIYSFYGEFTGVRIARKHLSWYSKMYRGGAAFRSLANRTESAREQRALTWDFFERMVNEERLTI